MSVAAAGIAGNPVLIGAATVLVVLVAVFLAYNANRACRSCRPTSSRPRCPSAANLVARQRRPHRRLARRRRSARSRAKRCDDGTSDRRAHAQARARTPARCRRTRRCSSARARRSASSTSRSRAGSRRHVRRRRHDPARRGHADAGRVRRVPEHVRRQDARGDRRRTTTGFGDAFAGRGESINTAIGAFRPLLRDIIPVAQNLSAPEHAPARASSPRSAHRRRSSRRSPRTQAQLFVNLDTTMARAERGRAPVHPGLDHRAARPRSTRRSASFPIQRPFLRNTEGLFRELRPGVARAAHRGAGARGRARDRHAGAAAPSPLNQRLELAAAGAADVRRGPAGAARHPGDAPTSSRR